MLVKHPYLYTGLGCSSCGMGAVTLDWQTIALVGAGAFVLSKFHTHGSKNTDWVTIGMIGIVGYLLINQFGGQLGLNQ